MDKIVLTKEELEETIGKKVVIKDCKTCRHNYAVMGFVCCKCEHFNKWEE